eukprot:365371-Chlamydomonas_euryale.AAC.5
MVAAPRCVQVWVLGRVSLAAGNVGTNETYGPAHKYLWEPVKVVGNLWGQPFLVTSASCVAPVVIASHRRIKARMLLVRAYGTQLACGANRRES